MKIVQPANNIISNLIGKQEVCEATEYRRIKYCVTEYYDGHILVFNTFTLELLSFEESEIIGFLSDNYELSDLTIKFLIEHYFLVPVEYKEIRLCDQVRKIITGYDLGEYISQYTIVTTTACNARCFYCFEAGIDTATMSERTSNDVADYIIKHSNNKKVTLNWFGGEPLCNTKAIDIICERLSSENINYFSNITTNAYLFDTDLIRHSKEHWNLKRSQVTLDGMSDTYNRVKNFKNGDANAFNKVIQNIRSLLEQGIGVTVRMNLDNYNYTELCELSDYLCDLFGRYEIFSLYAHPLFEDSGFVPFKRKDNEKILLGDNFTQLRWKLHKKGVWRRGTILPKKFLVNSCMADNKHAVLISADGKIGKCDRYVDKNFISDIYTDTPIKLDNKYIKKCNSCYDCCYYPLCIKLATCPSAKNDCPWYIKSSRELELKEKIIATYKFYT